MSHPVPVTDLRLFADASLGHRKSYARKIERDQADFLHGARIDLAQIARGGDGGFAVGAVDDVKAQ